MPTTSPSKGSPRSRSKSRSPRGGHSSRSPKKSRSGSPLRDIRRQTPYEGKDPILKRPLGGIVPEMSPDLLPAKSPRLSPGLSPRPKASAGSALLLPLGRSPSGGRGRSPRGGQTSRGGFSSRRQLKVIDGHVQSDRFGQNPHSQDSSPEPEARSPTANRSPSSKVPDSPRWLRESAATPRLKPLWATIDLGGQNPESPTGNSKIPTVDIRTKAVNLLNKSLFNAAAAAFEIGNYNRGRKQGLPQLCQQLALEIEKDVFAFVEEDVKAGKLPNYSSTVRSLVHALRVSGERTIASGALIRLLMRRKITGWEVAEDHSVLLNAHEREAKQEQEAHTDIIEHVFDAEDATLKCPECGHVGVHYERTRFENPFAEYVEGSTVNDNEIDKLCKCDKCGHKFWTNSPDTKIL